MKGQNRVKTRYAGLSGVENRLIKGKFFILYNGRWSQILMITLECRKIRLSYSVERIGSRK